MQAHEIRKAYLDFFQDKGHIHVPSSSLIPAADPTLLLTSAGMVQFKPYFTGEMTPPSPRLTSVQKCFRVSDVDEVGDASHLTFFEMLGNFSIGDYFKADAIAWGWEFVTQQMKLDPERLWVSVFTDDDEAHDLWVKTGVPTERIRRFGEADNYWGPAGDEGPCGPCSEVHYNFGGACRLGKPDDDCGPNCECGRFLELWNLVFMQFYQDRDGNRTPLPNPNIDTGMGLERAAVILQEVDSIYETDLFQPIVERVVELSGKPYSQDSETDVAIRVVAEHARSATFLIADGVVPSNEGRGYVLRHLIRRAIRYGRKLGLESVEGGFLSPVADIVIQRMSDPYPELASGRDFVLRVLQVEEEQFGETYVRGTLLFTGFFDYVGELQNVLDRLRLSLKDTPPDLDNLGQADYTRSLDRAIDFLTSRGIGFTDLRSEQEMAGMHISVDTLVRPLRGAEAEELRAADRNRKADVVTSRLDSIQQRLNEAKRQVPGSLTFLLHDTYGFPVEVTAEIAREHGLEVDMEGFKREMAAQRDRARAAAGFGGDADATRVYQELGVGGTRFLGYDATTASSVVVALISDGESVEKAASGQRVEVVLQETPFYAEGGGQVGDAGTISGPQGMLRVEDTQSPVTDLIVHRGTVAEGTISIGDTLDAAVDPERRTSAARNHTATHLLHAALRQVLGSHVRQQGSLVAPDRLRFDFTHVSYVSQGELRQVEALVNDRIRANVAVHKRETTYRQAVAEGALAFFGDRYGDSVRVVEVPGDTPSSTAVSDGNTIPAFSYEVCGGIHLDATGDIGYCHITGESSIGAGLRRIEAVTGRAAEAMVWEQEALLERVAHQLETSPGELEARVTSLVQETARLRRETSAQERTASRDQAQDIWDAKGSARTQEFNGIKVVSGIAQVSSAETLRDIGDWLRDKLGGGAVVLGTVVRERPMLLVMVTSDPVARGLHAGNAVKEAAKVMGGGGGGGPEMAQAGGRDADKLEDAVQAAVDTLAQQADTSK